MLCQVPSTHNMYHFRAHGNAWETLTVSYINSSIHLSRNMQHCLVNMKYLNKRHMHMYICICIHIYIRDFLYLQSFVLSTFVSTYAHITVLE